MKPPEPRLELFSRAAVKVAPPLVIRSGEEGQRRVVEILSGRFEGRVSGEVLPGGADFQTITPDGVSYLSARYMIRTDDDVLILVHNRGIRHGVVGDDPSRYYFRSTPRFETEG